MILGEALHENGDEVHWNKTGSLRLLVVVTKQGLQRSSGLMVMRNLREQMVHNVCTNVMMDFVKVPVVEVNGGQPSANEAPFLASVPGNSLLVSVMVEVCDEGGPLY